MEKKDEEKVKEVLSEEMAKISNNEKMTLFLNVLLTNTERLMIGKRIFAFVLIDRGLTDMEISKKLHFTRATVERLRSRYERQGEANSETKTLVKQIENSVVIKRLLIKFLNYAIPAMGGRIPR